MCKSGKRARCSTTRSMKASKAAFSSAGPRAQIVICGLAGWRHGPSEQILEPAGAGEGIAFDVEEDVASRRLRQSAEPPTLGDREQFMNGRAGTPPLELNPGLLAHALIGFHRSSRRPPFEGQRQFGQRRQRVDAPAAELVDLEPRYAGDETEMVVIVRRWSQTWPPAADFALRHGSG